MTADWFLSRVGQRCGGCHARIAAATPMRRLRTEGVRCPDCAKRLLGEDPPASLDAPPPTPKPTTNGRGDRPLQPFVELWRERLMGYATDVKRRAGGDR